MLPIAENPEVPEVPGVKHWGRAGYRSACFVFCWEFCPSDFCCVVIGLLSMWFIFGFAAYWALIFLIFFKINVWASALCICFYINLALLNGSTQFHYCTISNPGTGADDTFVLKRGVWRNATWPSHSRPAIAASARHFQICFSPLTFWPLVCLPTLYLPSPFYALSHE